MSGRPEDASRATSDRCAGCGLRTPGGTDGCQAIFEELVGRDFSNALYFRVHRMMVDIYSLQHPERYCASAKSLAAHLTGLCWFMDNDAPRAIGNQALRRWLDGPSPVDKPELPSFRGTLTIEDVRHAGDPESYARAVDRWGRSTWEAYAPLHALARGWIGAALGGKKR